MNQERPKGIVIGLKNRPRWEAECVEIMRNSGIDLEIFEGHDGWETVQTPFPINHHAFKKAWGRHPTPGEIGCYASHMKIASMREQLPPVLSIAPDWRLVFEDDAVPTGMNGNIVAQVLAKAINAKVDFVFLHLGKKGRRRSSNFSVGRDYGRDVFTHAYLINLKALADMTTWEMRHPIDHAISLNRRWVCGSLYGPCGFQQRDPALAKESINAERHNFAHTVVAFEDQDMEPFPIKKVHQLWVGPNEIHPRIEAYCETVRNAFPGWEYQMWGNADMEELAKKAFLPDVVLGKIDYLNRGLGLGIRADVVRLEITRQHGGIYLDSDYEALRPDVGMLFNGASGFLYSDQLPGDPGIGLIGSSFPDNPLIESYLREIKKRLAEPKSMGDVLRISGPNCFKDVLSSNMTWKGARVRTIEGQKVWAWYKREDVTAFYHDLFHPYSWAQGTYATFMPQDHPAAWMAHHWAATWK